MAEVHRTLRLAFWLDDGQRTHSSEQLPVTELGAVQDVARDAREEPAQPGQAQSWLPARPGQRRHHQRDRIPEVVVAENHADGALDLVAVRTKYRR